MTIVSPSGREYEWTKDTPPTEEDIAALQAYDASLGQGQQQEQPAPSATPTPQPPSGGIVASQSTARGAGGIVDRGTMGGFGLPDRPRAIGGAVIDTTLEAGLPAAGQVIGGMTGPAAPAAIPILGAIGGAGGNALAQARRMAVGEQNRFLPGQVMASAAAGSVPGASLYKAGAREVVRQGARLGTANLVAKATETAIDEGRAPNAAEAAMAAGFGAAGAPLARFSAPTPKQTKAIENAVLKETVREVRAAGFPVDPMRLNPSWATKKLASIAGKANTSQEVAIRAQEVTTALARKELGLPVDAPLTRETLAEVRRLAAAPYRDIASISPQAAKDVQALNIARSEERGYRRSYAASANYEHLKQAKEAAERVQQLEDKIAEHALSVRDPGLVYELDAARTKIARVHDVEDALELGDGNISAAVVLRAWDSGKKLTGNLKTIAKYASAFPMDARPASRVPTPGVNQLSPLGSAALATVATGSAGPRGLLAGGIPLLSDPARSLLLSKRFQERSLNRFLDPPEPESFLPLALRLGSMSAGRQSGNR